MTAKADVAYSIPEAAKMLRVPMRTMRQAIARGTLTAHRPGPRKTFVWWSDATSWHHSRTPEQRSRNARRAARARWTPRTLEERPADVEEPARQTLTPAVANQRLTHALVELATEGKRPRCGDQGEHDLWLSESAAERAVAATRCAGCPVLAECAASADANNEQFGVWAGVDRTVKSATRADVPDDHLDVVEPLALLHGDELARHQIDLGAVACLGEPADAGDADHPPAALPGDLHVVGLHQPSVSPRRPAS